MFSKVYVEKSWMRLVLAAANIWPPLLKAHCVGRKEGSQGFAKSEYLHPVKTSDPWTLSRLGGAVNKMVASPPTLLAPYAADPQSSAV